MRDGNLTLTQVNTARVGGLKWSEAESLYSCHIHDLAGKTKADREKLLPCHEKNRLYPNTATMDKTGKAGYM